MPPNREDIFKRQRSPEKHKKRDLQLADLRMFPREDAIACRQPRVCGYNTIIGSSYGDTSPTGR